MKSSQDVTAGKQVITLSLTNNQALHLWGMMVAYIHDTTTDLKRVKLFTQKGELNKNIKHLPEFRQEQLDNLALAELIYKELEGIVDFSEIERRLSDD